MMDEEFDRVSSAILEAESAEGFGASRDHLEQWFATRCSGCFRLLEECPGGHVEMIVTIPPDGEVSGFMCSGFMCSGFMCKACHSKVARIFWGLPAMEEP